MGMFDYYQPNGDLRCPRCGQPLQGEWQGKDGPCGLFVWREGYPHPVEQRVDEESRLEDEERNRQRLPSEFFIYSYDCSEHGPVEAECLAAEGVWSSTMIWPFEPDPRKREDRIRRRLRGRPR
jgi:hypothetical protein